MLLKFRQFTQYVFKKYWAYLALCLLIILALFYWVSISNNTPFDANKFSSWYSNWIDPITGLLTFAIAVFLGIFNYYQEWQDDLPKKLTVHFVLKEDKKESYYMSCFNAYLAGESDIRQWGQKIGKQMNLNTNLDLDVYLISNGFSIINNEKKEYFKLHETTVYLTKKPQNVTGYMAWVMDINETRKDEYRCEQPLNKKPSIEEILKLKTVAEKKS